MSHINSATSAAVEDESSASTTHTRSISFDSALPGALWFAGTLFTAGFLRLTGWDWFWSILAWPYLLGRHFAP